MIMLKIDLPVLEYPYIEVASFEEENKTKKKQEMMLLYVIPARKHISEGNHILLIISRKSGFICSPPGTSEGVGLFQIIKPLRISNSLSFSSKITAWVHYVLSATSMGSRYTLPPTYIVSVTFGILSLKEISFSDG